MNKVKYEDIEKGYLNTEKVACDFGDWLHRNGYFDFEDVLSENQNLVDDFRKAYEVAPRLISLLADISDQV